MFFKNRAAPSKSSRDAPSKSSGLQISAEGIELIKKFEGCKLEPYRCSANVLTQGYGHTKTVVEGQSWSQEHAEHMLELDLQEFEQAVRELITVDLNEDQFSALVAFTFNVGRNNLATSTLRKVLLAKEYDEAPDQIRRWNKATVNGEKVVLDGLVRRRNAEALLFQSKPWDHI
jgi:lysozyme